jgi:hypothetical protein
LDSGATNNVREVKKEEDFDGVVPIEVSLAFESGVQAQLFINKEGTILGPKGTETIVSMSALVEVGFEVSWKSGNIEIKRGEDEISEAQMVNGLPALAAELSVQDQFYACIASKYYKFLTGISVNLDDLNGTGTTLSSGAQFHRQKVIDLGQSLKASSNTPGAALNALILSIVGSDAFVKPYQGQ